MAQKKQRKKWHVEEKKEKAVFLSSKKEQNH